MHPILIYFKILAHSCILVIRASGFPIQATNKCSKFATDKRVIRIKRKGVSQKQSIREGEQDDGGEFDHNFERQDA